MPLDICSRKLIVCASSGFPVIEVGVVKPHMKALEDGVAQSDVQNVEKITEFLRIVEERSIGHSAFLFGDRPTWADFYLYPPMADLQALPQWELAVAGTRFPRWMKAMSELHAVQKTFEGTLAAGRA